MRLVRERLTQVLAAQPAVLATAHVGELRPAASSDLPCITLALAIEGTAGTGVGRLAREGDLPVEHTETVTVGASTLGADRRRLRLTALPLRRNPTAVESEWGADDLVIAAVTADERHPYRLADAPAAATEFAFDPLEAVVTFGASQRDGERLEIVHWTVAWREDIVPVRYRGTVAIEIWGSDGAAVRDLGRRAADRLDDRRMLRSQGFERWQPAGWEPGEPVSRARATGGEFTAWRTALAYRFTFEGEEGGAESSGVPIRRIDVDLRRQRHEAVRVPRDQQGA